MPKKEQEMMENLFNALGDMLDQFEANEQYSEDDAAVIQSARAIYNRAKEENNAC